MAVCTPIWTTYANTVTVFHAGFSRSVSARGDAKQEKELGRVPQIRVRSLRLKSDRTGTATRRVKYYQEFSSSAIWASANMES